MSDLVRQLALFVVSTAHHPLVPHWLVHLGALGIFSVAVVDSSFIPLPLPGSTDLLLLWLVAYGGDAWLLATLAIVGSLLGGYATWDLGRRGGEAALRRYVPARLQRRIIGWVERHRILAICRDVLRRMDLVAARFVVWSELSADSCVNASGGHDFSSSRSS